MVRKKLLILIFACLTGNIMPVWSQLDFGVYAGYTYNELETTTGYRVSTHYKDQGGFTIGLPVRYGFTEWFALQAEFAYIQKNYKMERSGYYEGIYHKSQNNYLQLPLMAHFSLGTDKIRGYLNAGGYIAYWTSGKVKGVNANLNNIVYGELEDSDNVKLLDLTYAEYYSKKYDFDSRRDRRIELGWLGGAGMEYRVDETISFYVEARYYYSATDMQKDYMKGQIPRYNNTWSFLGGVMINAASLFKTR